LNTYLNEPTNADELLEYNLWEEKWIRCCKELNQWDELNEYSHSKETDVCFILDCAWKQSDWQTMKNVLTQQITNISKENMWKLQLYQGYYLIFNQDDYHLFMPNTINNANILSSLTLNGVIESKVEKCINMAIKEWRRIPRLVGPAHVSLLQAAQQIIELQEAFQIQNGLQSLSTTQSQTQQNTSVLQEIKASIKTWRTRLPLINDDISYWNDIFTWRQYHYEAFTRFYEKQSLTQQQGTNQTGNIQQNSGANHAMHGVHAIAHGIVHFGKIARKQHLYELCLATLNRIHLKQSVPIIDCYLKVKQEIKCYVNAFEYLTGPQAADILEIIEATNLRYFTRENVAELLSLKGQYLQTSGKYDDANYLYSFSIYLNDNQPKLWGTWGDYLCEAFTSICSKTSESFQKRSMETAESALIALLNGARHNPPTTGD
jgi:transformation/transcription domain-associated protein